jgi:hypothetical protein
MSLKLALAVFAIFCVIQTNGLKKFIRGRNFHKIKSTVKSPFPDLYYDQRLDHYDESNVATWNQRYWVNQNFFDGTGPVFIMIGGEGEENPIWMENGQWINFAKQYKALCVMLEHRYYGKSRPTKDLSTPNMAYLSSRQGLSDLAQFRQFIHHSFNLTDANRWISFGGSYPGSLSAWFRLKYPHLVYAAVSSSAPMLALVDFTDYMVVVNNSLTAYSPDCPVEIKKANDQVIEIMNSGDEGRRFLEKAFKTCDQIETDDDVTNFYASLSGNFEGAVQYNKDNRMVCFNYFYYLLAQYLYFDSFLKGGNNNLTIDLLCDAMLDQNVKDPLQKYINVNDIMLSLEKEKCLDASYDSFIKQMQSVNWNESAAEGGRQWTYQTCIEFGFFQSTDSNAQPFGKTVPVE